MVFHLVESPDDVKVPLVGFVVSKAVGNAVVRNKVKRRMRAIVANHLAEVPVQARVVVRSLPDAAKADFSQLEADYLSCLRRGLRRRDDRLAAG
ncbi:ribonuclease P protein component [Sanguibacter antarcticus]|uniref:Ribonuclease P protein component n=2 Tax=Sanguibacter antarcticus TaxID=372484 RepID=A0A2A9E8S7_9MICO|nr:ribonuclease P protein component [Sanguibacter antarcticus]